MTGRKCTVFLFDLATVIRFFIERLVLCCTDWALTLAGVPAGAVGLREAPGFCPLGKVGEGGAIGHGEIICLVTVVGSTHALKIVVVAARHSDL